MLPRCSSSSAPGGRRLVIGSAVAPGGPPLAGAPPAAPWPSSPSPPLEELARGCPWPELLSHAMAELARGRPGRPPLPRDRDKLQKKPKGDCRSVTPLAGRALLHRRRRHASGEKLQPPSSWNRSSPAAPSSSRNVPRCPPGSRVDPPASALLHRYGRRSAALLQRLHR
jgi:hypothetical protein